MSKLFKLFAVFAIALVCYPMAGYELTTAPTTSKYTLTSLSPTQVIVGSGNLVLTLSGTQFKKGALVQFGTSQLTPSYIGTSVIRVTVPADKLLTASSIPVSVFNLDTKGGATTSLNFYVLNPVPAISAITPSSLTVSTLPKIVTILGSGFVGGVKVNMWREGQVFEQIDPTSLQPDAMSVEIPATYLGEPGSVPISVTNPSTEGKGGGPSNVVELKVRGKAVTEWKTVVNNKTEIPGISPTRYFNSYNQPSVNKSGLVVFKGQSKSDSGSGEAIATAAPTESKPTVGIYVRDMNSTADITKITDNSSAVPDPNNLAATFIQFPSFPRIDMDTSTVAFRGQSQPVYKYLLTDGNETRIGTTGIFSNPGGSLATGASLLGIVQDAVNNIDFSYFKVPGVTPVTRFDQFPGSPAVTGNSTIVFKGNYTEGIIGKTGVFYRDLASNGGLAPVELIANSDTLIPNQSEGGTVVFGSTAPPSAANGVAVFVGLDNEDNPTMGGVYEAPLAPSQALDTIVGIGSQVPGERNGVTFNRLGEGLSFDGRYVAFWGAWGSNTKLRVLVCATDGNKDVIAACNAMYPNGYKAKIPVNQGIFVYDRVDKTLTPVAKTPGEFDDFVYWVFSGRPPAAGSSTEGGEAEPPRWRSSSFIAVEGHENGTFAFGVTFKAKIGPVDGIYLAQGPAQGPDAPPILTVVDTYMPGQEVDPLAAPEGSTVATVGMERDGLRGNQLVISSSMLYEYIDDTGALVSLSNAGIYLTPLTLQ